MTLFNASQSGGELRIDDGGSGLDTLSSSDSWKLGRKFPYEFVLGEKIANGMRRHKTDQTILPLDSSDIFRLVR